ncbi:hypothetical protein C8R44DRAFT_891866 [Mycena epipterygia]|nr:hypothetical protein C8R44DRAFT_891866 [Mycena epipterygia]
MPEFEIRPSYIRRAASTAGRTALSDLPDYPSVPAPRPPARAAQTRPKPATHKYSEYDLPSKLRKRFNIAYQLRAESERGLLHERATEAPLQIQLYPSSPRRCGFWNQLPAIFDLPPWSELEAMRDAATQDVT